MSISSHEARELAYERVQALTLHAGGDFVVLDGETEERRQGWVFFYNSEEFVRTGDPVSALAGNGPILVTRAGDVRQLPSGIPWETSPDFVTA